MFDFLRDCIDGYFLMSRQRDRKPLDDLSCQDLLQFIARARYGIGDLVEEIRVHEKNAEEKIKWKNAFSLPKHKRNPEYKFNEKDLETTIKEKNNKLFILLQNKFNNANIKPQTRESKIVLNQERIDEKKLLLLKDEKQMKKMRVVADHRKEIALEKLRNPFSITELREVIKIADEMNINLDQDLVELAAAKDEPKKPSISKKLKNEASKSLRNTISYFMRKSLTFGKKEEKEELQKFTQKIPENPIESLKALDIALDKRRHVACVLDQGYVNMLIQKPPESKKHSRKRITESNSPQGIK